MTVERISPEEVQKKLESGKILLVCAYENESRFKQIHLEGAISFAEFQKRVPNLRKDQEIAFY
jgi:hypothetical protein